MSLLSVTYVMMISFILVLSLSDVKSCDVLGDKLGPDRGKDIRSCSGEPEDPGEQGAQSDVQPGDLDEQLESDSGEHACSGECVQSIRSGEHGE